MLSVLLTILKILGISLLVLLGIILILLLTVLFIPIRYRIKAHRRINEEAPVVAELKATWFLHVLNAAFSYPQAAFFEVRIFCFTVFRSDRTQDNSKVPKKEKKRKKTGRKEIEGEQAAHKETAKKEETDSAALPENKKEDVLKNIQNSKEKQPESDKKNKKNAGRNRVFEFFGKLWMSLKNIKYTITRICDKIKHIVKNIEYYLNIIKSDAFERVWRVCSGQVFSLLKSIRPRKIKGNLLIGTGDPASTGQVLAAYGILYPLLGSHIDIVPDFEHQIIEGDLFIKGKITVCKVLKTALIIYLNKDLRRLIKLFKKEAV